MKNYIIVHGYNGSPKGHWQHWLYNTLKDSGSNVYFPQFTNSDNPNRDVWLNELHNTISSIDGEKIIICHSLGSVLWLHYVDRYVANNVSKVVLVAPAGEAYINKEVNISNFTPIPISQDNLKRVCGNNILIATQKDFYCEENAIEFYGNKLSINYKVLPDSAGHINIDSGYGAWDNFFELAGLNIFKDETSESESVFCF